MIGKVNDKTLSPTWDQLRNKFIDKINMIIPNNNKNNTKVIDETLSPTWDQLLLIPSVLVYGTRCHTYTYMTILSIYIMLCRDKHHSHRLWVNLSLVPCSRYLPTLSGRISRCPHPSQWSRCGTRTRWFKINLDDRWRGWRWRSWNIFLQNWGWQLERCQEHWKIWCCQGH